jgi:hypothetical protein
MKTNKVLLSVSIAVSLLAGPAGATSVRVDTIGQSGLLPDAQEDLNQASVFVHDVDGRRLFGGLNASWSKSRSESAAGSITTVNRSRSFGFNPSAEFVNPGATPWAVRYSPQYSESKSHGTSFSSEFRTKDAGAVRAILGWGPKDSWKAGVSAAYDQIYTRQEPTGAPPLQKMTGGTLALEGSWASAPKGGPRFIASAKTVRTSVDSKSDGVKTAEDNSASWELRALHERPIPSGGTWRFLASAKSQAGEHKVPSTQSRTITHARTYSAGAGRSKTFEDGTLWHTSALYTVTGLGGVFETRAGALRVAVEKPLSKVLLLRVGVDALSYNFTIDRTSGARSGNHVWWLNGTQLLGLGVIPSESVGLDFSLYRSYGLEAGTTSRSVASQSDSHQAFLVFSGAVDVRFH